MHLSSVRARSNKADLVELSAKAAVSLLRYLDGIVPADRAFFEAGIACRKARARYSKQPDKHVCVCRAQCCL